MSVYNDAMPDLEPGNTAEVIRDGHTLHVTATRHDGVHTGRRRYSVECLSCRILVHPATTGPQQNIDYHLRHPTEAWQA